MTTSEVNQSSAPACEHPSELVFWTVGVNETGWSCGCGAELGFRPDMDKALIGAKVQDILTGLSESEVRYVSNSTEGEKIIEAVVFALRLADAYDQRSILGAIFDYGRKETADFWRAEATRWYAAQAVTVEA